MFSNDLICEIIKYLNSNINNKIAISDIEKKFHYNRYYIMKLFKKEIGLSIIEYINSIRIYNSLKQMKSTNNKLINIAYNNGFYSIEYFSEIFKKNVGVKPAVAKKFFNTYKNVNIIDEKKIITSFSNLYNLSEKINKYLLNQKNDKQNTKVLTIFKKL